MYQVHWGLKKPPFPSGLDASLFYEGVNQRESMARLRFLLSHRRRLGLVFGTSGLGKSQLLEVFAKKCQMSNMAVAEIGLAGLSPREFYWQLGIELHASVRINDDTVRLFQQVNDRLQENALLGKQTVLLLDDLEQAGPDLANQICRLLRSEAAHAGWVTLVATVNSEHLGRLNKSFFELLDLRIDLEPWDELDMIGYLQTALLDAGAQRPLFDDEALSNLYQATGGVPRAVNRLADFALLAGSSHSEQMVVAATIQAASEAISLPHPV